MHALSLFSVFVLAKVLVLWNRDVAATPWSVPAYLWQDALVALLFAGVEAAARRRPWLVRGLYVAVVAYTALNVPVACLLSTPLTWPLLHATGGALADSIRHHVTPANIVRMTAVVGAGALLPPVLRYLRVGRRTKLVAVVAAVLLLPLGPAAVTHVDTSGLHRNPVAVLVSTALPRLHALDLEGDWRASPYGRPRGEDLRPLRGKCAGRNVVIVHLESTGARYLRPYGAAEDPTPNLTALCRHALVFENAYTTYPETIKSFFSVQCALDPALDTVAATYGRDFGPALANVLAGAGYRTGLFHSGRFAYLGMEAALRGRGYDTLVDAEAIAARHESSFGVDEPSVVRRMLGWIDTLPPGTPFLLTYLPIAGHHPYETPEPGPFPETNEFGAYQNALHYGDAALGQFLQGLRERGLEKQTLFVFLGDHGEAFGQHPGNYGHTLFVYEENVRVPLIVAAPGLLNEPMRVGRVASLVDTAPTVLDLLGLPRPPAWQGRSLLDDRAPMALFCTDYSLGLLGLRDGRWKLIHELESGRSKLFDLDSDPGERLDRAADEPERVRVYRDHLLRWAAAQKFLLTRP